MTTLTEWSSRQPTECPLSTTTASSLSEDYTKARELAPPQPGLVLIFADGQPLARAFPLRQGALELGRAELSVTERLDPLISRKHVRFALDGGEWQVADLGSRNGTRLGGVRLERPTQIAARTVVRVGGALLLPVDDVSQFERHGLGVRNGLVAGPLLRQALHAVVWTRQAGLTSSLMISGETGTGKEVAARFFHEAGGKPRAPYVAVNCATIPKDLAERLLFGSRRGAFSGATDAGGHVQSAHGGTLLLDEIAELPLDVQSKLLRLLETREVLPLGSTRYEKVDVQVCAATWRDLRAEVAAGRFREDLYFRIGQPEVRLPSLRERPEEIPWHIQHTLDSCAPERALKASVAFVDACTLLHWPGNVRELRAEVRRAAAQGAAQGTELLIADNLSPTAGVAISRTETGPRLPAKAMPRDEVAEALEQTAGNVVAAARKLGLSRNKIRRWLERHSLSAEDFKRGE